MNFDGMEVWLLALVTFAIVIGIAVWQRGSVARAQKRHEHSAHTEGKPGLRKSDGSDPGTKPQ